MLRRELLVEVKHDQIVVRVTGTSYAISYYRIASSSGLAARNLPARDDHRAPMSRLELQYLIGLAKATSSIGARVFEETRVTGVEESDGWQLKAGGASIHAKNVVLATNLPIAGPLPYDERTRPRSHIAMAFRIDSSAAIDGMFIGIDEPTHSPERDATSMDCYWSSWAPNSVQVRTAT